MMSARPRRAISSRMAGVRVGRGHDPTLPPCGRRSRHPPDPVAGLRDARRRPRVDVAGGVLVSAARRASGPRGRVGRAGDGPVGLLPAGEVARVRGAVVRGRGSPSAPHVTSVRTADGRTIAEIRTRYDSESTPSRSRVARAAARRRAAAVDPQQVGRDERVPLAALQRLADRGLQASRRLLVVAGPDVRVVLDVLADRAAGRGSAAARPWASSGSAPVEERSAAVVSVALDHGLACAERVEQRLEQLVGDGHLAAVAVRARPRPR